MRPLPRLVLVLFLAVSVVGATGVAAGQPPPTPTVLWKSYPLGRQASTTTPVNPTTITPVNTTPRRVTPSHNTTQRPQAGATKRTRDWWLLPALAAAVLTTAAIALSIEIYLSRTRRRGGHVSKFKLNRNQELEDPQSVPVGPASGSAPRPAEALTATTPEQPSHPMPDFGRLGNHVGTVLSAAEEAAARIQQEARLNARRVRDQAEKESAALVEAARHDAEAAKADAERARTEAEDWTEQTRETAEAYAAEKRSEAEAEAAEIIRRAEQRSVAMRVEAERRQTALELDISHAENRLRELVSALHDLADRLDSVLSVESNDAEADSESFVQALTPTAAGVEEAQR